MPCTRGCGAGRRRALWLGRGLMRAPGAAARRPRYRRIQDEKETTVYKRAMEVQYQLKMKASRELLSEVQKKYPTMLFRCGGAAGVCPRETARTGRAGRAGPAPRLPALPLALPLPAWAAGLRQLGTGSRVPARPPAARGAAPPPPHPCLTLTLPPLAPTRPPPPPPPPPPAACAASRPSRRGLGWWSASTTACSTRTR